MKNILKTLGKWLFNLHLGRFLADCIEDLCILSGLTCIVIATFLLSKIAGLYMLGACLFGLGIWFTKNPLRKG